MLKNGFYLIKKFHKKVLQLGATFLMHRFAPLAKSDKPLSRHSLSSGGWQIGWRLGLRFVLGTLWAVFPQKSFQCWHFQESPALFPPSPPWIPFPHLAGSPLVQESPELDPHQWRSRSVEINGESMRSDWSRPSHGHLGNTSFATCFLYHEMIWRLPQTSYTKSRRGRACWTGNRVQIQTKSAGHLQGPRCGAPSSSPRVSAFAWYSGSLSRGTWDAFL